MKFRSLVLLSALAAMSVPAVEMTGSNTFGWLKVDSGLANTIVAVPWVECGTGEAIKVANLVKTDNLTVGDKLYVYMGGTWYLYELANGAWEPATTVATATGPVAAAGAADQVLARGAALFLQRADATKPFYLYGQYSADSAGAPVIAQGSAGTPAYTLLANPAASELNLNKSGLWTNVGSADSIVVPLTDFVSREYTWKDGSWGYMASSTTQINGRNVQTQVRTTENCIIPIGTGFWYVSRGGAPTVAW